MKIKFLNFLLIITSLFGYLEWSGSSSSFLFQAEWELMKKIIDQPTSVLHPFTILPFLGQLLLLISLFQKEAGKRLTISGISLLGLLIGFMFLIGIMALNFKILFSTLPFLILSVITIVSFRKKRTHSLDSVIQ